MNMKSNVGSVDRGIRSIIGIIILSMFLVPDSSIRWFGLLGLIPIASAYFSFCPLYHLLGINTCKSAHKNSHHKNI